jgi:hypothetical protein
MSTGFYSPQQKYPRNTVQHLEITGVSVGKNLLRYLKCDIK